MGLLEQIEQMKSQGMPDNQIISTLQQQGISPTQINDALSQAQVKSAVSGQNNPEMAGMQPSIMDQAPAPMPAEQGAQPPGPYSPSTQEMGEMQAPMPGADPSYGYEQGYDDYAYGADPGYYAPAATNTDTIIEVSEQVFQEKIATIKKKVEDFSEFKTLADTKIEHIEKRLAKLETVIDQIHSAILDKISSYGSELGPLKKELSMVQDSFAKMVGPLTDKASKRKKHKRKSTKKKTTKRKSKKK